jgi:hypothetical protein
MAARDGRRQRWRPLRCWSIPQAAVPLLILSPLVLASAFLLPPPPKVRALSEVPAMSASIDRSKQSIDRFIARSKGRRHRFSPSPPHEQGVASHRWQQQQHGRTAAAIPLRTSSCHWRRRRLVLAGQEEEEEEDGVKEEERVGPGA